MNRFAQFLACGVQLLRQQQHAAVRGQEAGVSAFTREPRHLRGSIMAGGIGAVVSAANARQVG